MHSEVITASSLVLVNMPLLKQPRMTSGFSVCHIILLTSYHYSKIVSEHLQHIQSYAVQEKQEAGMSFLAAAISLTEMLANWQQTGSPDRELDTQGVIITYPIRNIWIPCISRAHIGR